MPLPDYGMHCYLPFFSEGAKVTSQVENAAVTETAPVAGLEGAEVKTATGQVIISQQLHERGFTGGGAMDEIIGKQIKQQLDERVDIIALNAAIEKGNSFAAASSFSLEAFWEDIAHGREEMAVGTPGAGVRLRATHLFTTTGLYGYVSRQVDTTNKRPIVTPDFAPGFPLARGADDWDSGTLAQWARFTGSVMPGGLLWFTDDNIPLQGTTSNTQILVSAPEEAIVLAEGTPILTSFPQTAAATLQVVVNLREYCAVITRHAAGTSVISGNAYKNSLL